PAIAYTEYTLRIFKDLLGLKIGTKNITRDTKLLNLIGSIKYSEKTKISIADIAFKIIEIFICSKYFKLSIKQAEKNLEEIKKEYNLNELFEENLINMAGITRDQIMKIFQGVFGEHGENLRPIMKVKEFYGRDDEDPHEWCVEFEKAYATNG